MRTTIATLLSTVLLSAPLLAAPSPLHIDSGLAKLYSNAASVMPTATAAGVHAQIAAVSPAIKRIVPGRFDSANRVLIHVYLNSAGTMAGVSSGIVALNGSLLGNSSTYGHGVLAAYLPTDQIANASKLVGVRALTMEHMPVARVGTYTSQGATVLQTKVLNQFGLKGQGITYGVLSDSFNTAYQVTQSPPATTAPQDVTTGDLPVVNVLEDYPAGTDEGRAMCQIIYDEAPKSNIAFATAFVSEIDFANNIVGLRATAGANVIVDDISYYDEPVFSDGLLSQAVNAVATSKTLPGKPAIYCSSAGNDGNNGYRNFYRNLTDSTVRQPGNHGNLKLNVTDPTAANYLDPSLTAGGWYNWNQYGGLEPSTAIEAPGPTTFQYALFLQWDDPFDQDDGITTSYNFLVFDANGNYLPALSSTTSAFDVQQPLQAIGYLLLGTQYQIAITTSTQTDPLAGPIPATHQLQLYSTLDGASFIQGKYFSPAPLSAPNIIGHPGADGAIAVAAYCYSFRDNKPFAPELENFTSPGPVSIYFNKNYKRLAQPVTRLKPEVAGVDGVVTTFFGSPYYQYPYAFFGTSAAAPSVAAVAGLCLQAAGGPGSLNVATMKAVLEGTALPRNSTVQQTQAFGASSDGFVSVTALGQSYFGPGYFTVNYYGGRKNEVDSITIDGRSAGLVFDTTKFILGTTTGISASAVSVTAPVDSTGAFTIKLKKGSFTSGDSFTFTVGQDVKTSTTGYTQDEYGVGTEAEDLAYGATATATFGDNSSLSLPFLEGIATTGYSPADGFGLVNGIGAVSAVLPISQAQALNTTAATVQN